MRVLKSQTNVWVKCILDNTAFPLKLSYAVSMEKVASTSKASPRWSLECTHKDRYPLVAEKHEYGTKTVQPCQNETLNVWKRISLKERIPGILQERRANHPSVVSPSLRLRL